MGILDRLRGGGKKQEEDELKDNIEKIRQKIQEGEGAPAPDPGEGPDREMERPPAPEGGERPPRPDAEGRARPPREGAERPAASGGAAEEQAADAAEQQPGRRPGRDMSTGGGRSSGQGPDRPRSPGPSGGAGMPEPREEEPGTDLPEPPEVRELDLPDVEEGPLYVEVDTFRTTLQALADMRRVARELDDHVGSMEGTLDEDRETSSGMTDLLDRAEHTTRRMRQLLHNE